MDVQTTNIQSPQKGTIVQRQVAHKIWLSNLLNGQFVQGFRAGEQFSPSFVQLGEKKVSRVNVIATLIDVFKSEDGNYFSFTVDDGTASIRLKAFNEDTNALLGFEKGCLVLVVGRVREYQGELYIAPEITRKITDLNDELVRKAELLQMMGKPEQVTLTAQPVQATLQPVQQAGESTDKELRQKVLDMLISHESTGAELRTIVQELKKDEATTEAVLKELLLEGEIYENKPGCYKAI